MTTKTLIKKIINLCKTNNIEALYAFGSRADEIYSAVFEQGCIDRESPSDVDLAVKLSPPRTLDVQGKVELAMAFEDLLGANRVDLAILSETDPFIAVNIIRGNRIFCEDAYMADEYEIYLLRRAGDLAPFERERIAMVMDR